MIRRMGVRRGTSIFDDRAHSPLCGRLRRLVSTKNGNGPEPAATA